MQPNTTPKPLGGKVHRPGQGASCNHNVGLNAETGTLIDVDGEEVFFPVGLRRLEVQPRLCGDHYAELYSMTRCVSAVGKTRPEAIKAAIAKIGEAA